MPSTWLPAPKSILNTELLQKMMFHAIITKNYTCLEEKNMQKRNYFLKFLSTFILAVLIASFSSSLAKADSSFTVCNLNMVLQDDPSTSIFFSWRTAPVSSSSTPQLETAIIYCESSQELDAATAQKLVASSQVSSRTAYYKASLTGLKPGTTYTYAIMDTGSDRLHPPILLPLLHPPTHHFPFYVCRTQIIGQPPPTRTTGEELWILLSLNFLILLL